MSEITDFGDWRIELVENYQGQPHLIGAQIVTDAFMVGEIRGAVMIDGRPHELHMEAAHLFAAAPKLLKALRGLVRSGPRTDEVLLADFQAAWDLVEEFDGRKAPL